MTKEDMQEMFDRQAHMHNKFWLRNMPQTMFERMLAMFIEENECRMRKANKK